MKPAALLRPLLWLAGTLPLLALLPRDAPLLGPVAHGIERVLGGVCQNDPSRALTFLDQTLPCCARCSGLYFGLGLGALPAAPKLRAPVLWVWFCFALLLMALDVSTELLRMRPASAGLRLATGVWAAYPASLLALLDYRDARQPSAARLDPTPAMKPSHD